MNDNNITEMLLHINQPNSDYNPGGMRALDQFYGNDDYTQYLIDNGVISIYKQNLHVVMTMEQKHILLELKKFVGELVILQLVQKNKLRV